MARGQHKVFLGMAVGVGKTFRMLQEGHSEASKGHDVVIGLLETHGRSETAAMAEGLELVPRRPVPWHGTIVDEDLHFGAGLRLLTAVMPVLPFLLVGLSSHVRCPFRPAAVSVV